MACGAAEDGARQHALARIRRRNALIFGCIAAAWLIADQVSKRLVDAYQVGDAIAVPLPGILAFKLAHNTGGAWSLFGDMTMVLAALSVLVCAFILAYLFFIEPGSSVLMTVGLALVFAGGVGNLIDRVTGGYVIDFIQTLFIDFPIFNIADIGVTCGVVIVLVALIAQPRDDVSAQERD